MTFPLFVVVVGVDTRWMETSLKNQLAKLVDGSSGATTRDYLEKIFQIPYWTRRMESEDRSGFVGRIVDEITGPPATVDSPEDEEFGDDVDGEEDQSDPFITRPLDQEASVSDAGDSVQPRSTTTDDTEAKEPVEEQEEASTNDRPISDDPAPPAPVRITEEEKAILVRLAPFAGHSPRQLLRFVNVYALIKSVAHAEIERDDQTLATRAIIGQLAIAMGDPSNAIRYFEMLAAMAEEDLSEPRTIIHKIADTFGDAASEARRSEAIMFALPYEMLEAAGLLGDDIDPTTGPMLKRWAPIARRYTFAAFDRPKTVNTPAENEEGEPSRPD